MRMVKEYARIRVPATTVLCGSRERESVAIAVDVWDDVAATIGIGDSRVTVTGPAKHVFSRDDQHPTLVAMRATLDAIQAPHAGIALISQTKIPPAVGLGSRTAAMMAGILLVRELMGGSVFSDNDAVAIAASFNISPARALASINGGVCLGWDSRATKLPLRKPCPVAVLVPKDARTVHDGGLPQGPVGVLSHALTQNRRLLSDVCSQVERAQATDPQVGESAHLLRALHDAHWPVLMAGSGPALLVFSQLNEQMRRMFEDHGFECHSSEVQSTR